MTKTFREANIMKCIKKGKQIQKVSDKEAVELVKGKWKYCPKHEWREKVRDAPKTKAKK